MSKLESLMLNCDHKRQNKQLLNIFNSLILSDKMMTKLMVPILINHTIIQVQPNLLNFNDV